MTSEAAPVVAVLGAALGYGARGWRVVANYTPKPDGTCDCHLGAKCDSPGKHPRTMHGALDASADAEMIERRFGRQWPYANVGIATGGNLVVLDVDPRNGGGVSLQRFIDRHGALPETPTVLTGGGGLHFYFDPGDEVVSSADLKTRGYPGLELKSTNLQVIAPPSLHPSGQRYVWETGLSPDDVSLARIPAALVAAAGRKPPGVINGTTSVNGVQLGRAALRFVAEGAPIGSQRLAAVAATRNYLSAGRSVEETIEAIWHGLQQCPWDADRGAWTEEHARRLVASVAATPAPPLKPLDRPGHTSSSNGTHLSEPPPPPPAPVDWPTETRDEPPSRRYNDFWNAEQFVNQHGDRVRYCGEAGWFCFIDGVWQEDRTGRVNRWFKRMTRQWLRDAARAETDEEAKVLASWAIKCHSVAKMDSTLRAVQTEAKVAITITDFDAHPVLFNAANGTVNLRTGHLQPHCAEDLLSKQSPVVFDPNATCPVWQQFLIDVFSGDQKLIAYVQRLLGYSMTGLQLYHLLVFLWGAGRNGKTTLLEGVSKILGEYARSISSELLLTSRENGDYNVAQLRGVRLAITSETGQHRKVDEARVKLLTGGDTLPARHPYGRPFTFAPTHHVWAMSNHKPTIEGQDRGIWSRVKLIEFPNRFELPPADVDPSTWQPGPHIRLADPTLPAKFEAEQSGILNWLIRGAVDALRDGLQEPASVSAATEHYREQMDVLGGFLDECCDVGPYLSDTSARLYSTYKSWCANNGVEPVANNKFGMLLAERGEFNMVKLTTGDRLRRWSGLQVKAAETNDER